MRFWQSLHFVPPEELIPLAREAEAAGFAGVSLGDHLVRPPADGGSPYPYTADGKPSWPVDAPFPDPWVTSAAIAQATTTLQVSTSVYVLPARELFAVAKAIATAAFYADGRIVPGLGVGWLRSEFDATGARFLAGAARLTRC